MVNKVLFLHRPNGAITFLANIAARQPIFSLVAAYSATVQLPGTSGAGTTLELREFTATADIEILAHGKARCLKGVPSNPTGAPGPSIITRAVFNLLPDLIYMPIDAGLKLKADASSVLILDGATPAKVTTSGQSVPLPNVIALFNAGIKLGRQLGQQYGQTHYLTVGESVPGGTTTALGLLLALGLDAEERVSSSMPGNAHQLKLEAVQTGFAAIGRKKGDFAASPLEGVAALGDPMQAAVAGMALAASAYCPVLLGGGTQMAAVVALMAALKAINPPEYVEILGAAKMGNMALATTRWVSADPTADLAGLARHIEERFGDFPVAYMAANLNFAHSRYAPMQLYEQGFVKEGVGAGAAAIMAMLHAKLTPEQLLPHIERVYEQLVLGQE